VGTKHRAGRAPGFLSHTRLPAWTLPGAGEWQCANYGHSDSRSSFSVRVPNAQARARSADGGNRFEPSDSARQTAKHSSRLPCTTLHTLLLDAADIAEQLRDSNMRRLLRDSDFSSLAVQWRGESAFQLRRTALV